MPGTKPDREGQREPHAQLWEEQLRALAGASDDDDTVLVWVDGENWARFDGPLAHYYAALFGGVLGKGGH